MAKYNRSGQSTKRTFEVTLEGTDWSNNFGHSPVRPAAMPLISQGHAAGQRPVLHYLPP